jgi:hypothetical protein
MLHEYALGSRRTLSESKDYIAKPSLLEVRQDQDSDIA